MANTATTLQHFIHHLSRQLGTPLTLRQGVCALYDSEQRQAAVIEAPAHGDSVLLHCRLGAVQPGADHLQRLLAMNFDMASLRGCWLALDKGDVRLCTQRELAGLDEERFAQWFNGFVVQARDTRAGLGRALN